jgi:hypothetical protein
MPPTTPDQRAAAPPRRRTGASRGRGPSAPDLWRGPLPRFVELARSGSIAAEMVGAFQARHGSPPGTSEIRSWEHSLTALAEVLRDSRLADSAMAVRAAGWASGAGGGVRSGARLSRMPFDHASPPGSLTSPVFASTEWSRSMPLGTLR